MPATAKRWNRIPKDHPAYGTESAAMAYYRRNPKKCNACNNRGRKASGGIQRYRARYPNKYKATTALNNAVRDDKITPPCHCETCKAGGKIHGHHADYLKPLEVDWLCYDCHRNWHRLNGPGANA